MYLVWFVRSFTFLIFGTGGKEMKGLVSLVLAYTRGVQVASQSALVDFQADANSHIVRKVKVSNWTQTWRRKIPVTTFTRDAHT